MNRNKDDEQTREKTNLLLQSLGSAQSMEIVARVHDSAPNDVPQINSIMHTIIHSMPEAIILTDQEMSIIESNNAATDALKLKAPLNNTKLKNVLADLVIRDSANNILPLEKNALLKASEGERVIDQLQIFDYGDGIKRHFIINGHPIFDESGELSMALIVARDVTELKKLESRTENILMELTWQRDNWKRLVDNMTAGVIFLDSDLRILHANRTYAKAFSPKLRLREGARIEDVLPLVRELGIVEILEHVLQSGRSANVNHFRYDGIGNDPTYWNGSAVPVRLKGKAGLIKGLALVLVDVTNEKKAREKMAELAVLANQRAERLEQDRSKLDTVIKSTPVPLVVCSGQKCVLMYNSATERLCRDLGLIHWLKKPGNFLELAHAEMLDQDGNIIKPGKDPLSLAMSGKICNGFVIRFKIDNSPYKWLSVNSAPIRFQHENKLGAVLAIQDITDKQNADEKVKEIYHREHKIAEKLQQSFLPGDIPQVKGFDLGHKYSPALDEAIVGGDFYDLFWLGPGKLGIVIADVAGKGLKAAVYTAMTKYMLKAYALENSSPELVLTKLNEALSACTPPEIFVTLIYGILDVQNSVFTYANAGHEQPAFYSHKAQFALSLDVTGRALALVQGSSYTTREVNMHPGDILVMYTDGVTDAGWGINRLGVERVLRIIEARATGSASEITKSILSASLEFSGNKFTDDAALLVIKATNNE